MTRLWLIVALLISSPCYAATGEVSANVVSMVTITETGQVQEGMPDPQWIYIEGIGEVLIVEF